MLLVADLVSVSPQTGIQDFFSAGRRTRSSSIIAKMATDGSTEGPASEST